MSDPVQEELEPEATRRPRLVRRRRRRRRDGPARPRAIPLLPNLVTSASLVLGFWSLTLAYNGRYVAASLAIIAAAVLDSMDGRIARATKSTSPFGVEYDSLADLVSFGVAPGFLMYASALEALGPRGFAPAAFYTVCAAFRLARFNVQSTEVVRAHNHGLASTMAGGIAAVTVWFLQDIGVDPKQSPPVLAACIAGTLGLALLMVSRVPYPSWKSLPTRGRPAFAMLVAMLFLITLVVLNGVPGFFLVALVYLSSGPLLWLWLRKHGPSLPEAHEPGADPVAPLATSVSASGPGAAPSPTTRERTTHA
jgi:CDP-diacylglycerol--serine O-phosphatidyltransferase